MKHIGNCPLKCGSNIFEAERELLVREHTPWADKRCLLFVGRCDIDLIITRIIIHRGKDLAPHTLINDLINEGSRIVVFRTSTIKISIICPNADCALFFSYRDNIRHPVCKGDGIDEPSFKKLFNFTLNSSDLPRMHQAKPLVNGLHMQIHWYFMHHNARIDAKHFFLRPCKHITKFLK